MDYCKNIASKKNLILGIPCSYLVYKYFSQPKPLEVIPHTESNYTIESMNLETFNKTLELIKAT